MIFLAINLKIQMNNIFNVVHQNIKIVKYVTQLVMKDAQFQIFKLQIKCH